MECYVHLADVEFSSYEISLKNQSREAFWHILEGWPTFRDSFRESSWFKRDWTLQELIALVKVVFYDSHWNEIGPLEQVYMDVAEVTRIGEDWLVGRSHGASVAVRMSRASRRQTKLEEDMAYCLLGLFDVNMPPLYGEGAKKAFYRHQIEIMKISDDESLFTWISDQGGSGLLAAQPSYFAYSGVVITETYLGSASRPPYSIKNKGLEISVPKKHLQLVSQDNRTIWSVLRYSTASTKNAQMHGKALYIELYLMEQRSVVRATCAMLKETDTLPDKSEYRT
ncbi:MAG: hypothetical protein MMC33_000663 [Icmadophila ericetorum]|nr:hypothetical protein [Icmadophila ericetorum]